MATLLAEVKPSAVQAINGTISFTRNRPSGWNGKQSSDACSIIFVPNPAIKCPQIDKNSQCTKDTLTSRVECHMPWNGKVKFDLEKYFQGHPYWKGIWSMVRCSCVTNMSFLYIYYFWLYAEFCNSQVWDNLKDIGQGHSWSSVINFHYLALCRFNPTSDRSQWMSHDHEIIIKCNLNLKNMLLTHVWKISDPW